MYYDEAISLVEEGHRVTRDSWDNAYIYKDKESGIIKYFRKQYMAGVDVISDHRYISSESDMKADDWRTIE